MEVGQTILNQWVKIGIVEKVTYDQKLEVDE
jgi:hypothetical protein